jgi:hypothetical protein
MAVFKIIQSRRGAKKARAEFEIQPISGGVVAGDQFQCFDTHHPIDFRVQCVQKTDMTWSNKTLEPTRVGALSSAVAVHVHLSRVAQLGR